jgi:hypothetical protein
MEVVRYHALYALLTRRRLLPIICWSSFALHALVLAQMYVCSPSFGSSNSLASAPSVN